MEGTAEADRLNSKVSEINNQRFFFSEKSRYFVFTCTEICKSLGFTQEVEPAPRPGQSRAGWSVGMAAPAQRLQRGLAALSEPALRRQSCSSGAARPPCSADAIFHPHVCRHFHGRALEPGARAGQSSRHQSFAAGAHAGVRMAFRYYVPEHFYRCSNFFPYT